MAKGDIISVTSRPLTDEEQDALERVEALEAAALDNLEAGARQIISLVTAFYGLIFGAMALGRDKFEATLGRPWIIGFGSATVVLLLLALGAALVVVIPYRYDYGEAHLDDIKAVYHKMLAHKSAWLRSSTILFGLGLVAFAILIIAMLAARF